MSLRLPAWYRRLLRPDEVAAAFSVDIKTVGNWGRTGRLQSVKLPGSRGDRRYFADEVDALIERSRG